ncbi:hypothetical protein M433DRAFT_154589 [Acidomyces richmondensis BFW]|nr:hypothetical protein M433DRAFT_154589 [Acidomyces richmondensis BFW]
MPSTSPGQHVIPGAPTSFAQVLPGAATSSLQGVSTFLFRHQRYIVYISGKQVNILLTPVKLVQTIAFREELVAVIAESQTGKIIAAGKSDIYVLEPLTEGWTRVWWEKELFLRREDVVDEARYLSWGQIGEALVGGSRQLSLFSTLPSSRSSASEPSAIEHDAAEERRALWAKPLASPVQYASFNSTSSLIATCGIYDRLVKIWRRLSFEDGLFDYTYLPHPGAVTHIEWRPANEYSESRRSSGIGGRQEEDPEVLFTIANDGVLRVWRTGGQLDIDILVLHTSIDLVTALPSSPTITFDEGSCARKPTRYAFILPSDQFCGAAKAACGRTIDGKISNSLEHLKDIMSKEPDVVVTLDANGLMSAWGLQSVGHKRRPETPGSRIAFHIAHAEDLPCKFGPLTNARFVSWFDNEKLQILIHRFDGHIVWWHGDIEIFFSPSAAGADRLRLAADWTGHHTIVQDLELHVHGKALFSRSEGGEVAIWNREDDGELTLRHISQNEPQSSIPEEVSVDIPYETGIQNPMHSATNDDVAAQVSEDGKELVIVDLEEGYIEHRQKFDLPVRKLRCFNSSPSRNFLVVAFEDYAIVLAQGRYEHHDKPGIWTVVKRLSISSTGLSISAIEWMHDGAIAIGAGNAIMLSENTVSGEELNPQLRDAVDIGKDVKLRILDLPQEIKEPLPTWHPRVLSHLVRSGKITTASAVVRQLAQKLKFWSEGEDLEPILDMSTHDVVEGDPTEPEDYGLNKDLMLELVEQLRERDLPSVSQSEQDRLRHILESLVFLSEHQNGLDKAALRYLFSWQVQLFSMAETTPAKSDDAQCLPNGIGSLIEPPVPQMFWRDIAFAYHSNTQQPLLDILTLDYDNKLTWPIAKRLGITAWLADRGSLASVFDGLAQTAYRSSYPYDPVNASLYFLALHKKQILLGLWRIATWHREQRATMKFLQRDFNQNDAKVAAKKNAFALMGKRRFEYAAAFFLLADDPNSACNILAGQCEDIMLAIAVARLYSGDDSSVLHKLLDERLIPQARERGDRWQLSWCYAIMQKKREAANVLVEPLRGVRQRTWRQDDPSTLMLYVLLRQTGSKHEYDAVLRAARVLRRMGLWLLALELVRNWQFHPSPVSSSNLAPETLSAKPSSTNGIEDSQHSGFDNNVNAESTSGSQVPKSILHGFASSVADSLAQSATDDNKTSREAKAAKLLANLRAKENAATTVIEQNKPQKKEPTHFHEPDPNSILDNFGF